MRIYWSKVFTKNYKKLSKAIQHQAETRTLLFSIEEYNPMLNNHRLNGKYTNKRSINVNGDYRIIFEKRKDGSAEFLDIGTHAQLYK